MTRGVVIGALALAGMFGIGAAPAYAGSYDGMDADAYRTELIEMGADPADADAAAWDLVDRWNDR